MKFIQFLIVLNFWNCFTTSYEKKYDPSNQKNVIHEFSKEKVSVNGKAIVNTGDKKIQSQFDSVLIGKNRILNIHLDLNEKKSDAFDTFVPIDKNTNAIFAKDKDFNLIIGNDSKIVFTKDLDLKDDFSGDTIHYFAVFSALYGTIFDLYYVELNRSEEDRNIFIKKFYPKKLRFYSENISWVERDRTKYYLSNTFFHLGYVFTITLDILTGIFQVIFYLMSGGVK